MGDKLIMVDSPTKAQALTALVGPGTRVVSTYGVLRDFSPGRIGIDLQSFEVDTEIAPDRAPVLLHLIAALRGADRLVLAFEPGERGEALAFQTIESLALHLTDVRISRCPLWGVCLEALQEETETLDDGIREAYWTRRVLERMCGFLVSPVAGAFVRRQNAAIGWTSGCLLDSVGELWLHSAWRTDVALDAGGGRFDARVVVSGGDAATDWMDEKRAKALVRQAASLRAWVGRTEPFLPEATCASFVEVAGWAMRALDLPLAEIVAGLEALYENGIISFPWTNGHGMARGATEALGGDFGARLRLSALPFGVFPLRAGDFLAYGTPGQLLGYIRERAREAAQGAAGWLVVGQMGRSSETPIAVALKAHVRGERPGDGAALSVLGARTGRQGVADVIDLVAVGVDRTKASVLSVLDGVRLLETGGLVRQSPESGLTASEAGAEFATFLRSWFGPAFGLELRAEMERELSAVAAGDVSGTELIAAYWRTLQPLLADLGARVRDTADARLSATGTGERCPRCGKALVRVVRRGIGTVVTCIDYPRCIFTRGIAV